MKWLVVFIFAVLTVPMIAYAGLVDEKDTKLLETNWKKFDEAATQKTSEIKALIFGPITRIMGILGIAYGVIMACMGQTKQLITFGGIGLLLNVLPYFIDSIYGAILPRL